MEYFTPRLWIAFQGPHRNAALKTWDRRFKSYRDRLTTILRGLSPSARRFFRDALVLHDGTLTRMKVGDRIDDINGELTRRGIVNRRALRVRLFVLGEVVRRRRVTGNAWYVLEYKGVEGIQMNLPGHVELFPTGADTNLGDWGYDELTSPKQGLFRHEILFSSGATIAIDFRDLSVRCKLAGRHS